MGAAHVLRCPAGAADGYPASCAPAVDLGPKASMPSFVRARFQAGDCMPDDASACSTTDGPNDRAGGALIVPRREACVASVRGSESMR